MGLRGPLGEKPQKEKGKKRGEERTSHGAAGHVGIVPHGQASKDGCPPSPLYSGAPLLGNSPHLLLLLSYLERGSISGAAYEEGSLSTIRTLP